MLKIATVIVLAGALSLGAAVAQAQEKNYRGSKEDREACTPDVHRLCGYAIPDENRIVACLKRNRRNLSPACRRVFSRG
jgi:Cysteine rich repeat